MLVLNIFSIFEVGNIFLSSSHARIQRGGGVGNPDPHPLNNHKNIGFLSNTGADLLKNHKAPKVAFKVGPSLARLQIAIYEGREDPIALRAGHHWSASEMSFRWRANDGPLLVLLDPISPHQKKL